MLSDNDVLAQRSWTNLHPQPLGASQGLVQGRGPEPAISYYGFNALEAFFIYRVLINSGERF